MSRVKVCPNSLCTSYDTFRKFSMSDNYCPKCGQKLVEVCKTKKCNHPLTDAEGEFCHSCQSKKDQRKAQIKNAGIQAKNIGEQAITVYSSRSLRPWIVEAGRAFFLMAPRRTAS